MEGNNYFKTEVFEIGEREGIVFLKIPAFEKTGLVNHLFSTRKGGVSSGIFESMNLGFNRGDSDENVLRNHELLCEAIGVKTENLVLSTQVHKDEILIVDESHRGTGLKEKPFTRGIDGLITNKKGVALETFYADCVPLYFLDPVKKVIALAHAGWRGTVNKIGFKIVDQMVKAFDCDPKDILAAIGPSIGPCCFEVSEDVKLEFDKVFNHDIIEKIVKKKGNGKYFIDLWTANEFVLLESGIVEKNITKTDLCTMCHKEILFSHRGSHGERGSLVAIMALKE
jgi:YfiH family protein